MIHKGGGPSKGRPLLYFQSKFPATAAKHGCSPSGYGGLRKLSIPADPRLRSAPSKGPPGALHHTITVRLQRRRRSAARKAFKRMHPSPYSRTHEETRAAKAVYVNRLMTVKGSVGHRTVRKGRTGPAQARPVRSCPKRREFRSTSMLWAPNRADLLLWDKSLLVGMAPPHDFPNSVGAPA